ncbi:MFS transporter [Pontibaca methylaminivorans]|uniref:MFS transporter n=1 Tax=Pontibaca methylaminivorans TaxID=515897 RepID=UPI002FDAEBAA
MNDDGTDKPHDPAAASAFSVKPLMFMAFVCSMAMMVFVALAGPIARVLDLPPWQIGAAMTIAGVGWMVMARVWGGLSDSHGRRPVLLLGLAGFTLSYLLLALFIDLALRTAMAPLLALAGLLAGRGIAGLFYAAVPATSTALVADHTRPEERTSALAAIGASSAAGMVVGPGLAGLVAPFGLSLPFHVTAVLPVIALLLIWLTLPAARHNPAPARQRLRLLAPRLRRPMMVAFAAMFSVSVAQIIVGFFALDRLGLGPVEAARAAGLALAAVGISLVCAQVVLRRLGWPPARLIRIGALIGGTGFASAMLAVNPPMLWASYAFAAFGMGWVYPSVPALAANSVEAHEQGAAAGTVAAAQGLGTILGPIAGTLVYGLGAGLPYALVGALLVTTALWRRRDAAPTPNDP